MCTKAIFRWKWGLAESLMAPGSSPRRGATSPGSRVPPAAPPLHAPLPPPGTMLPGGARSFVPVNSCGSPKLVAGERAKVSGPAGAPVRALVTPHPHPTPPACWSGDTEVLSPGWTPSNGPAAVCGGGSGASVRTRSARFGSVRVQNGFCGHVSFIVYFCALTDVKSSDWLEGSDPFPRAELDPPPQMVVLPSALEQSRVLVLAHSEATGWAARARQRVLLRFCSPTEGSDVMKQHQSLEPDQKRKIYSGGGGVD